jgi:hypothetical protein
MQNYLKKYLIGVGLFLLVLGVAQTIGKISYFDIGRQSATVLDILPDDAKPASGFAWSDSVGWINFGTSTDEVEGRVYVSNNKLYGYAWGENIGWISLNCENDDSCDDSNYGVTQTNSNGVLSGFAWGENIGWIDFAPDGGGVFVATSTSGVNAFSGYAWGENIGWISFTGISPDYGVTTTWNHPAASTPVTVITISCSYEYSDWSDCVAGEQTRTVTPDAGSCSGQTLLPLTQTCTIPIATSTATTTMATSTNISVSIQPASSTILTSQTLQLTATVTGTTTNNSVDWSIFPVETIIENFYGQITETGLYTAPPRAVDVTIQARAKADNTKVANANVSVRLAPATTTPCTAYTYSDWSICTDNNQTRTVLTDIPTGCVGGASPIITQTCTMPIATSTATTTFSTSTDFIDDEPGLNENNEDNNQGEDNNKSGGGHSRRLSDQIVSVLDVSTYVTDNIAVLGTTTEKIVAEAKKIIESPVGNAVAKTITTAGVVGGGVAASSVLVMNGTAMTDLLFLPFKLWGLLLSALGLKKRNRPWGTVYDSITKQPIDPAYVTLKNLTTGKEITSITDLDGRYGFLVSPGKYTLVANKTNYTFPSKKALGKTIDTLYGNLYFGEEIKIETAGALISKNIPLDPVKFDWNEFVKGKKKLMKFYSQREKLVRIITDWIFRIGFAISLLSLFLVSAPYNLVIFGLYILLTILRKFGLKQKALGALTDKKGNPLSFALVHVFDADLKVEIVSKVADKIGRYYCLVNKGKYYVKVEKKNDDESYTEIFTSPIIDASNGIINRDFTI